MIRSPALRWPLTWLARRRRLLPLVGVQVTRQRALATQPEALVAAIRRGDELLVLVIGHDHRRVLNLWRLLAVLVLGRGTWNESEALGVKFLAEIEPKARLLTDLSRQPEPGHSSGHQAAEEARELLVPRGQSS